MRSRRTITTALLAGAIALAPACSDEDGDGGVTDEEIEDVENEAEDLGDQVEEEIDAQDEGSNDSGG